MGNVTIEIHPDGPRPVKSPVQPNDTVIFTLVGIQGVVEVSFESPCCFTSNDPLTLDSSNTIAASSQQKTVSADARDGTVTHFDATLPDTFDLEKRRTDGEVKRGEVDVSTDGGW